MASQQTSPQRTCPGAPLQTGDTSADSTSSSTLNQTQGKPPGLFPIPRLSPLPKAGIALQCLLFLLHPALLKQEAELEISRGDSTSSSHNHILQEMPPKPRANTATHQVLSAGKQVELNPARQLKPLANLQPQTLKGGPRSACGMSPETRA